MKKNEVSYKAIDYSFFYNDELLYIFKDINYLFFSLGTIKTPSGELIFKYKRGIFWKNRFKIVYQNFNDVITLEKENKKLCLFLQDPDGCQKLSITSKFKLVGSFEGDFFLNDFFFGKIIQDNIENKKAYSFIFKKEDMHLAYYFLILFAVKYYYYIDEVA